MSLAFVLNGEPVVVGDPGMRVLIDVLRHELGLTGTREGCGKGECGACTVLIDGKAVNACLFPAAEVEGCRVTTIEGLAGPGGTLHPISKAFVLRGGIQCGFCSPGMILATKALLDTNPHPSDAAIRDALRGNLCRCTGYVQIIEAIREAANTHRG